MRRGHVWGITAPSGVRRCEIAGCTWIQITGGVAGDARIRYAARYDGRPILQPGPCTCVSHKKRTP